MQLQSINLGGVTFRWDQDRGNSFFDLRRCLEKTGMVVRGIPAKKPNKW